MYKEDSFKRMLFWLKIKRIFFIIFITLAGSVLGGILSSYLVDVLMFYNISKNSIIAISTIVFFVFANFLTTSISQTIQEGYWKMATLRKLTLISKKLDSLKKIEEMLTPEIAKEIKEIVEEANDIKTPINEDNYSIFDEYLPNENNEKNNEITDNGTDFDASRSNTSHTSDEAFNENGATLENNEKFEDSVHETMSKSHESSELSSVNEASVSISSEQLDKLENTKGNIDHISKTMAIISHEYGETHSDVGINSSTERNDIIVDNSIEEEKIEEKFEQAKIEDIEDIVNTIKIENKSKHTYKRKIVPGSSNAIAMATAFEKNKEEIKFKNNIIEENASSDDNKNINNENENSK